MSAYVQHLQTFDNALKDANQNKEYYKDLIKDKLAKAQEIARGIQEGGEAKKEAISQAVGSTAMEIGSFNAALKRAREFHTTIRNGKLLRAGVNKITDTIRNQKAGLNDTRNDIFKTAKDALADGFDENISTGGGNAIGSAPIDQSTPVSQRDFSEMDEGDLRNALQQHLTNVSANEEALSQFPAEDFPEVHQSIMQQGTQAQQSAEAIQAELARRSGGAAPVDTNSGGNPVETPRTALGEGVEQSDETALSLQQPRTLQQAGGIRPPTGPDLDADPLQAPRTIAQSGHFNLPQSRAQLAPNLGNTIAEDSGHVIPSGGMGNLHQRLLQGTLADHEMPEAPSMGNMVQNAVKNTVGTSDTGDKIAKGLSTGLDVEEGLDSGLEFVPGVDLAVDLGTGLTALGSELYSLFHPKPKPPPQAPDPVAPRGSQIGGNFAPQSFGASMGSGVA